MPSDELHRIHAYIDGANLHRGIQSQGWALDYRRFRIWLKDKYGVTTAYLFLGMIPKYAKRYQFLQECGYVLVFKEVVYGGDGKPKGNCDADLVLQATRDHFEKACRSAVVVTSDGDYASLVKLLLERDSLSVILSPAHEGRCSILLKRTNAPMTFLSQVKNRLQKSDNKKAPG